MQIDKDPAFYNLLVGIVMGLLGLLNSIGFMVISSILKNQEKIYGRLNKTDEKLTALKATHDEIHRRHE